MAAIDLTLNSFIVPRISTFTPPWGTVQTDPDHPGLSTQEAVNNLMMAFNRMRPIAVTENSTTTKVEADASLVLSGTTASLTLGQGDYKGVELKIFNDAGRKVNILDKTYTISLEAGDTFDLRWNGTDWRVKTDKHVGDIIVQHPSTKSPEERRLEGTWLPWSSRASLYAIGNTAPTTAFINDWKKFRHDIWNLLDDGVTVASTGAKKYAQPGGYVCVSREDIQADWAAADLTEGTRITGGTYSGKYIWQVIAFAGIFFGVEDPTDTTYSGNGTPYPGGGKRPTFEFDGVQPDRIRDISGEIHAIGLNNGDYGVLGISPLFTRSNGSLVGTMSVVTTPNYLAKYKLSAANVVPTGDDNAPTSLSVRFWRRMPDPV
jgi:hypothetical protein